MYIELWGKTHSSVCSIQHWKSGEKIASGSGFMVDGYLITNNHVFFCPPSDKVIVEFVGIDGETVTLHKEFTKEEFNSALEDGSPEECWDYAILKIDDFKDIPCLKICNSGDHLAIGAAVGLLGYAFGNNNLSIHSGIISSRFIKKGVNYIQIDASVNQGNSGGPLIDFNTSEVIGVVTRAAKGLTIMFDDLIKSFDTNITVLSANPVNMRIGGINPIEMLTISQRQMGRIANEIKRSANVGIGYAFTLDKIRAFLIK